MLQVLGAKPIIIRESLSKAETDYLDAIFIRDQGKSGRFRERIELVWRMEQYSGWGRMATNFFCYFVIGWLLAMNSGWVGSAYAAAMARLAEYLLVVLSFCYVERGLSSFRILLSTDPNSLLDHDSIYKAFPRYRWIALRIATWTAVVILCYLCGMIPLIRIFAASVMIAASSEICLRGRIMQEIILQEGFGPEKLRYEAEK